MRTLPKLVLVAASVAGISACAGPMRSVTHISTWSTPNGDYFYVAYAEDQLTSRVKLCRVQQDNAVVCVDQPEVDRLLNP